MTVNQIIKKAIERLKNEGKLLTPDFYMQAFCEEAKRAGILVEDCNQVDKFLNTLDTKLQNEIKQYRIRTAQELVRFLISKINRMQPTKCAELLASQTTLSKRVLQAVELLHNTEASSLAKKTIILLDEQSTPEQIDHVRQAWVNFLTLYDDTFLQKLSPYGRVDSNDLKKTIENLSGVAGGEEGTAQPLRGVASLMIASLVPSIASSVNDDIANLSESLRKDPQSLNSQGMADEIRSAIRLRIALDKESLKEMVMALDIVLDKLSLQLIDLIERSDSSTVEIQGIKKELEAFETEKQIDFKTAHKKLFTIAVALEEKTELLSSDLREHSDQVNGLSSRVNELEKELAVAQHASKEDFLTKLYNKRALDEFLRIKEGEFERYGRNYCVIMFDLDLFKKVNDTYGHEAGDAVLAGFAKVLKKQCRDVDIVGRFGGEEFMALLSDTDLNGGIIFAQKVNEHVKKTRFIYKGERIDVTVSAGVAQRKDFPSVKATVNSADQHLYDAKKNGRNRVEPSR
ncbi:MAG: GGDEF domain-containing protein [Campylobacterota bacterium]|nr:GGDEF domain-containing protein [Campylobacterota bacterium]